MQSNKQSQIAYQREKYATQIRRKARLEDISRRRNLNMNLDNKQISVSNNLMNQPDLQQKVKKFLEVKHIENTIETYIEKFTSGDNILIHEAIINLRKYVSQQNSEMIIEQRIQKIIDANIVIKLIEYMKQTDYKRLQIESAWIVTNILAGNDHQCRSVTNKGAIPIILDLMSSNDPDVVEQIVWSIGNLCGQSVEFRDMLLSNNIISKLVNVINTSERYQTVKQAGWSLSSLCRRNPPPHIKYLRELAQPVYLFFASQKIQDLSVINHMIWALVVLTDQKFDLLKEFFAHKVLAKLIGLFVQMPEQKDFVAPILSVLGNIVTSSDYYIDELLKFENILALIQQKLSHQNKSVREQAVRFFQYFAASTTQHIQYLFRSPTILFNLVNCLDQQPPVQLITIKALSQIITTPLPQILQGYYRLKVYAKVVPLLNSSHLQIVLSALECVEAMLIIGDEIANGQGNNLIKVELENNGLIETLEKLQQHQSEEVYQYNLRILNRFYEQDHE